MKRRRQAKTATTHRSGVPKNARNPQWVMRFDCSRSDLADAMKEGSDELCGIQKIVRVPMRPRVERLTPEQVTTQAAQSAALIAAQNERTIPVLLAKLRDILGRRSVQDRDALTEDMVRTWLQSLSWASEDEGTAARVVKHIINGTPDRIGPDLYSWGRRKREAELRSIYQTYEKDIAGGVRRGNKRAIASAEDWEPACSAGAAREDSEIKNGTPPRTARTLALDVVCRSYQAQHGLKIGGREPSRVSVKRNYQEYRERSRRMVG